MLEYKLFENEIESKTVENWQRMKTILWKWPGEHAASGTFKNCRWRLLLSKSSILDNSIAPTECTKARCFDTPNQNFFSTDEAMMRRLQLPIPFTWLVYICYLVMLRETKLWQNTVISHSFRQKFTQDLRQRLAWNRLLRWSYLDWSHWYSFE